MKTTQHILKGFVYLFCILSFKTGFAQNVGISTTAGFVPDASAGLDISYTNKGLLVPRVALTATNAAGPITSPATSLLVYNTATAGTSPNNVTPGYYYWNGTAWTGLSTTSGSGAGWLTTGNAGTVYPTNFLGTTDLKSLRFRTNNTQAMLIDSAGNAVIGNRPIQTAGTSMEKFLVDAGSTSTNPTTTINVISGKGYINNYMQLNIQNKSAGTNASSDVVATNDLGTEANGINFIDMGVNSSAYSVPTSGILNGINNTYLYSTGNDMIIGNATSSKSIILFTGGTAISNEAMRINGSGNIGMGTITPAQKLDVTGSIKASTSIISQGSVFVDAATTNTGALSPGLILGGAGSGESISSKRTAGTNQYGIDFYTSGNNRMTIANGGNVGIGTNTPGYTLTVAGIVAPTADNTYSLGGGTTNRWTAVYATNGTIQTSDRRLKTNIKTLNYGLKEVLAMQPVSYNWKEKPTTGHKIGLIAQDVRKLVPEVVTGDEAKEKLGMNYAELVPVLINAIKEQQKQIDDLKKAVQKRH